MVYITRKEAFSAAHRLARAEWSDEKNAAMFGKCSNPNWHGHNYDLYVTVKGDLNAETGFVANMTDVSSIIKKYVLDKVDHRNLNLDVDFMKGRLCSTEVLATEIWNQIEAPINALGCKLHCIKLQETEKNCFEYYGN